MLLLQTIIIVALLGAAQAFRMGASRPAVRRGLGLRAKVNGVTVQGELAPLSSNLLIKVKQAPSTTAGGLYIPDSAKERPAEGTVVAAGAGLYSEDTGTRMPMSVAVGDQVIYDKHRGFDMKYNDLSHQVIRDEDVLLRFPGGATATEESVSCVRDDVLVKLPRNNKDKDSKEDSSSSSSSGLFMGAKDKDKEQLGRDGVVVKMGSGRWSTSSSSLVPMPAEVQVGDRVRLRDFAGHDVRLGGELYVLLPVTDLLAKWEA